MSRRSKEKPWLVMYGVYVGDGLNLAQHSAVIKGASIGEVIAKIHLVTQPAAEDVVAYELTGRVANLDGVVEQSFDCDVEDKFGVGE